MWIIFSGKLSSFSFVQFVQLNWFIVCYSLRLSINCLAPPRPPPRACKTYSEAKLYYSSIRGSWSECVFVCMYVCVVSASTISRAFTARYNCTTGNCKFIALKTLEGKQKGIVGNNSDKRSGNSLNLLLRYCTMKWRIRMCLCVCDCDCKYGYGWEWEWKWHTQRISFVCAGIITFFKLLPCLLLHYGHYGRWSSIKAQFRLYDYIQVSSHYTHAHTYRCSDKPLVLQQNFLGFTNELMLENCIIALLHSSVGARGKMNDTANGYGAYNSILIISVRTSAAHCCCNAHIFWSEIMWL